MTWTYDGDPSASTRDEVRFRVGDTDADDPQLSDAEIAYLLATYGDALWAAVYAAEGLAAKYARKVNIQDGVTRLDASDRMEHYQSLATSLRAEAGSRSAAPWTAATSATRKQAAEDDADRVVPSFAREDV